MNRTQEIDIDQFRRGILSVLPLLIIVFTLAYLSWDSAYTVQAYERAVIFRFGKIVDTVGPGLHFKLPIVDDAVKVNVAEEEIRLPFDDSPMSQARNRNQEDEALMLTGDLNAAVVEWTIQWQIVDPAKYLVSIEADMVPEVIRAVARTVMHQQIGDYSIDEVLTTNREEVGEGARRQLQDTLDSYDSGIQITGLQMQRVTPPTMVKPSFDAVNASVQRRDQLINEAKRERNELIPRAEAMRDRLIKEAQGYADKKRAETTGEIAALRERYNAYKQAPEVTRQRLYLEAMEEILSNSGPKIILDDKLKSLLPLLNLNSDDEFPSNGEAR